VLTNPPVNEARASSYWCNSSSSHHNNSSSSQHNSSSSSHHNSSSFAHHSNNRNSSRDNASISNPNNNAAMLIAGSTFGGVGSASNSGDRSHHRYGSSVSAAGGWYSRTNSSNGGEVSRRTGCSWGSSTIFSGPTNCRVSTTPASALSAGFSEADLTAMD
jgi:hypothetical protein